MPILVALALAMPTGENFSKALNSSPSETCLSGRRSKSKIAEQHENLHKGIQMSLSHERNLLSITAKIGQATFATAEFTKREFEGGILLPVLFLLLDF
jgi:hypothetical protein